jgi:hypothetical protein
MIELNYQFPSAIDNTMRTAWDACQRKFLLSHVYNLRAQDPSMHLVFGGAFAAGLECARKEFYGRGNTNPASYLGKAFITAIEEWDKHLDDPLNEEAKSLLNCLCALDFYFKEWPMATDWIKPLADASGKPAIEFTFAIPLGISRGNEPVLYTGRFDMLADYATEPAVYDDKTTTQLGAQWVKSWSLNSQLTGYIWAAREHGFDTSTAIIRGVSILKKSFGQAQAIEHRTDWEIRSWYNTLHHNIEGMLAAFDEGEDAFLPSYGQACAAYGGCPYQTLCKKENWKDWIEPDFRVFVWDPLAINKVKINPELSNGASS